MANPVIIEGATTGYIGNSGDTWLMCLYTNDRQGVIKLIGSKYDLSQKLCYEDITNQLIKCVPATKSGLRNKGVVLVRADTFNYGCIESFACSSGEDCTNKTCTTFGNRVSFETDIPIRSSNSEAPSAPTGLTISPGDGKLDLSWDSVPDQTGGEVFAYDVRLTDTNGNVVISGFKEAGSRNATISDLTNGSTYNVEVRALSHNNVSSDPATGRGTPSTTGCSSLSLSPNESRVSPGGTATLTINATPTTQDFNVVLKMRDGSVVGNCTTSGGTCTVVWNVPANQTPGTYYITAYVGTECVSAEVSVIVLSSVKQFNINITVSDSVTLEPISGATVIAGNQTKITDSNGNISFMVNEGLVSISISATGYTTFTTTENIFKDMSFIYDIVPSNADTGSIRFRSKPAGAEVFLGSQGTVPSDLNLVTPAFVSGKNAGNYTFALKLAGYADTVGDITVTGGMITDVYSVLVLKNASMGNISVFSTPLGADISLDDVDQKITTPSVLTDIPPGSHTIKLSLNGYNDLTVTVNVVAGQTTYINPLLTSLGSTGAIEINTIPEGAEISLNGEDQFKITPSIIDNILPGTYKYTLNLPGYNTATGEITVESGKTTIITVTLKKGGISAGTIAALAVVGVGVAGAAYYISRRGRQ